MVSGIGGATSPTYPSLFFSEVEEGYSMPKEIWKDIPGYEGLYQVSNLGRVKSLDRTIKQKDAHGGHCLFHYKERLLKIAIATDGYGRVSLANDGRSHSVHRLVAQTFIPNPENKPMVNHINGNRADNNVSNLEWCTNQENQIHAVKVLKRCQGAHQNKPIKCIETGKIFDNSQRAAEAFGKGRQVANRIRLVANKCYGRRTCMGFHWEYLNGSDITKTGKKHSERETDVIIKPVRCVETGVTYKSIAEASRKTGAPVSTISNICNHRKSGDKTMHWEFI